jgi:hypothetical protein
MKKLFALYIVFLILTPSIYAQGLLDELDFFAESELKEEIDTTKKEKVQGVFFGNRIINGQSTQMLPKKTMEFIIAHRFGTLNSGFFEFFGLDNASVRFGFEYAITDWMSVSFGRSSYLKTWDFNAKAKFLTQKENGMPISGVLYLSAALDGRKRLYPDDRPTFFNQRLSYTSQLLVSRKMTKWLSLQVMPTLVHYNLVETSLDKNALFLIGVGTQIRFTHNLGITAEYYARIKDNPSNDFKNTLAIGIDYTTGGHVFQFQFTNAQAMFDSGFMRQTTGNFWKGDVHFGFNITRNFAIGHNKEGGKKGKKNKS